MATTRRAVAHEIAEELPVAQVVVDAGLPHLDREFDYLVPAALAGQLRPGVRVKVPFAGRDADAYLVRRVAASDHGGALKPIRRLVSPVPVATAGVLTLARAVADHYAGCQSDVLRLAIAPRHARVENDVVARVAASTSTSETIEFPTQSAPASRVFQGDNDALHSAMDEKIQLWQQYPAGPAFLARLQSGENPAAIWRSLPGATHWAQALAAALVTCAAAGRGAIAVLPDRRDVDTLAGQLVSLVGADGFARLEADAGPAKRYRAFLQCLLGQVRIAIGTRAAAYAPLADPGLLAIWDDGDDNFEEPRAPYPHTRTVLEIRARQQQSALLVGGWSVSVESAGQLARGDARYVGLAPRQARTAWPRVVIPDPHREAAPARLPHEAWDIAKQALTNGPVLVQVPRAGYIPALACQRCRTVARCHHCHGQLHLKNPGTDSETAEVSCSWCGRSQTAWACSACGGTTIRALAVGVQRTAAELARSFPDVPVIVSKPERELPLIEQRPALVVATCGVEPPTVSGYAAALLLDGDSLLARADLRAGDDALRRWLAAAALVRAPHGQDGGGVVALNADPSAPAAQAVMRGDPAGYATWQWEQRHELSLPPAAFVATLTGSVAAVSEFLGTASWPVAVTVLGPALLANEPQPAGEPTTPTEPETAAAAETEAAALAEPEAAALFSPSPETVSPQPVSPQPVSSQPVSPQSRSSQSRDTECRAVIQAPVDSWPVMAKYLKDITAARSLRHLAVVRLRLAPRNLG